MPWTKKDFPVSMKNLPSAVRNKAVEIANALVDEGMKEGLAIATAISRAKDWAANRGKKAENPERSDSSDVKQHGEDRYVIPYEDEWAVKAEGEFRVRKIFRLKAEAVKAARKQAKAAYASLTIQNRSGRVMKRISYNPNKRAPKRSVKQS